MFTLLPGGFLQSERTRKSFFSETTTRALTGPVSGAHSDNRQCRNSLSALHAARFRIFLSPSALVGRPAATGLGWSSNMCGAIPSLQHHLRGCFTLPIATWAATDKLPRAQNILSSALGWEQYGGCVYIVPRARLLCMDVLSLQACSVRNGN